jgi:single-stranded-DNA-specific exonuclease
MDFEGFLKNCKNIANQLKAEPRLTVVGHYDADGLASTAILVKALKRAGVDTDFINTRQMDSEHIKEVNALDSPAVCFVDMGSGQIELLEKEITKKFYIIDHHPPVKETPNQVNPFHHGINGTRELSATGVAYFVAREMDEKNRDLSPVGIIGAVGDMQDLHGGLKGANRKIIEDAEKLGLVNAHRNLKLFGRQSRPLPKMLEYCSEPMLPGLTGNYMACSRFIQQLGIPLKDPVGGDLMHYVDLNHDQRSKLTSALYMLLLDHNAPSLVTDMLIGEVYDFPKEKKKTELRDAKEFATVLNACGRHEEGEVGVEVCMGGRDEAWSRAKGLLEKHRKELREGISWVKENGIQEMPHLYWFDASGVIRETLVGIIAGMSYGAMRVKTGKPIIAFGLTDEGELKISGRGNYDLVRKGLKLGEALNEAAKPLGGEGGGHDVAAGAKIPNGKQEEFLKRMDEAVARQLGQV